MRKEAKDKNFHREKFNQFTRLYDYELEGILTDDYVTPPGNIYWLSNAPRVHFNGEDTNAIFCRGDLRVQFYEEDTTTWCPCFFLTSFLFRVS